MKSLKPIPPKRAGKQEREKQVLLGLIEHYIKTGKPVGSNTLKEAGFENLSSATIRNYFAKLESEGYLTQHHASGGRIPTNLSFRFYAHEYINSKLSNPVENEEIKIIRKSETREIAAYLLNAAELLSKITDMVVFLSAPRFDNDYVVDLKLVAIDHNRCLCIIVTDFGVIQTEVLHINNQLNTFSIKRIESYFTSRLRGGAKPENLTPEEEELAQRLYNELSIRYIVGYTNFSDDEIHRTGFSKLLNYPDFHDPKVLAKSLSFFENVRSMRLLLKETTKLNQTRFWVGEDLTNYASDTPDCAVVAVPYHINQQSIGAIGVLGPVRIPYRTIFEILHEFSDAISEALTRNIYKFKISFRQPQQGALDIQKAEHRLLGHSHHLALDNQ